MTKFEYDLLDMCDMSFMKELDVFYADTKRSMLSSDDFLEGLDEVERRWARFEIGGSPLECQSMEQCCQRVIDMDCGGRCGGETEHAFHSPMVVQLHRGGDRGAVFGKGWILKGATPARDTGGRERISNVRLIQTAGEGSASSLLIACEGRDTEIAMVRLTLRETSGIEMWFANLQRGGKLVTTLHRVELTRPQGLTGEWYDILRNGTQTGTWSGAEGKSYQSLDWRQYSDVEMQARCMRYILPKRDQYPVDEPLKFCSVRPDELVQPETCHSVSTPNVVDMETMTASTESISDASFNEVQSQPRPPTTCARQKEWPCLECGKVFKVRSKLYRHTMTVHRNIRLYSCNLCSKKFKEKGHLQKHMKSHDRGDRTAFASRVE